MAGQKTIMATCTHCREENVVCSSDEAAICTSCGKPFVVKNGILIYEANHVKQKEKNNDEETEPLTDFVTPKFSSTDSSFSDKAKTTGKKAGVFLLEKLKQLIKFLCRKYKEAFKKDWKKTSLVTAGCIILAALGIMINLNSKESKDDRDYIEEEVITVIAPGSSSGYSGNNYEEVVSAFQDAGFTNVTAMGEEDLVLGIFNSEGAVDYVMVDGSYSYSTTTDYDPAVEVIIKYHSFPVKETEIDIYPFENVVKEDIDLVKGTYVGNDNCGLTIFEDGTCEYYAPSFPEIEEDRWTIDNGILYIRSKGCGCTVQADISSRDVSSFNLVSSSLMWTDETYVKVNDKPAHISGDDYKKILKDVTFKCSRVLNRMNYKDAEKVLKNEGFTNIKTVGLNDMVFGIIDTENQVESVSIDGNASFTDYSRFDKSADVTIKYHCYDPNSSSTKSTSKESDKKTAKENSNDNENTNEEEFEDFSNNSSYEMPMKAVVVCITNYYADDISIDGNKKDMSKYHSYDDMSGFYFKVLDYGKWKEDKNDGSYSVSGLKLQPYNTNATLDVYSATVKDDSNTQEMTVSNLFGYMGEVPVSQIEEDDATGVWGTKFLTIPYSLIKGDRTKAIPGVKEEGLSYDDAYDTFYSYCDQNFNRFDIYDLSQCHYTKNSDGSYFFKWSCKCKNSYGQKVKFIAEGTVYGHDINDARVKNFNYY